MPDGEVWLFGYGSLIWRPDVEFVERSVAVLPGYRRRFWQRSTDHRGTVEQPGRVVTLVEEEGAQVVGMAYRLVDPEATLARVDVREQQGYARVEAEVEMGGGRRRVIVYVADRGNPYFVGDEAIEVTAAVIAGAHGPSGANVEYVRALVAALGELGVAEEEYAYEREVLAHAERRVAPERGEPRAERGAEREISQ